jgi:hypothetical protein
MGFEDSSENIDVCLKFRKHEIRKKKRRSVWKRLSLKKKSAEHEIEITLQHFTQKHSNAVLYNYNLAEELCKKFQHEYPKDFSIRMNDVFICASSSNLFWVEKTLKNFESFWDLTKDKYIDKIISSNQETLTLFQMFVYEESGYEYTIIDLQGEIDHARKE